MSLSRPLLASGNGVASTPTSDVPSFPGMPTHSDYYACVGSVEALQIIRSEIILGRYVRCWHYHAVLLPALRSDDI